MVAEFIGQVATGDGEEVADHFSDHLARMAGRMACNPPASGTRNTERQSRQSSRDAPAPAAVLGTVSLPPTLTQSMSWEDKLPGDSFHQMASTPGSRSTSANGVRRESLESGQSDLSQNGGDYPLARMQNPSRDVTDNGEIKPLHPGKEGVIG
jgi:hypothetical protein